MDKNIDYSFNLGTIFDSILNDINKPNEINCIYKKNYENEIQLLHDYNFDIFGWGWCEEAVKLYLEAKEINKKLFEENIELYINDKKVKFNYKYKFNENNDIK